MDNIFFSDLHAEHGNNLEDKFRRIVRATGFIDTIEKDELVAIKLHVGERGNLGYLNHNYARLLVEEIRSAGGKPYLTDTNTLYTGGRHNGVDHAVTAGQHGFSLAAAGAPFIPADGIRGTISREVPVPGGKRLQNAKLAEGILQADRIIFLNHLKGHEQAGFGGSVKNMAMGCASVTGKLEQHSDSKPVVDSKACIGCRNCFRVCPADAITMVKKKAVIDYDLCIGCGQCVAACNYEAMNPRWDSGHEAFIEKMAEYAWAVHSYFGERACYVTLALNITPDCDCFPANDAPIVEDVGMLASPNPFALDRAAIDLASAAQPNKTSRFAGKVTGGGNPFHQLYEKFDNEHVFTHLSSLGAVLDYELKKMR
jgi:uncharacterized Fe-S center protein